MDISQPTVEESIAAGQEKAAEIFEEREYITTVGSTGDKDPWDDAQVDKGEWVGKVVDTLVEQLPQYPVEIEEGTPVPERLGEISKSLNLGRGYAEHWERYSCRELVQNWFDACVERTGGDRHAMQVTTTTAPAAGLGQGADGIIYIAHYNGILAGYLADYEAAGETRSVDLVNLGGMITVDAMVLGNSSKRGQSGATGFFGEGVKVEINRLTACGVEVKYVTPVEGASDHHALWNFSYHAEQGGASEVLHLHMDSADGPTKGVSVHVRGLPRGGRAIDPANFLFLQGGYTRVSAPPGKGAAVAGIDVLLDPAHEGKIYVGGIFALPWATLKGIGLDYTGGGDSFKHVGLGRDRTSVHVHELIHLLPAALHHQRGTPQAEALLARIFDTLQVHPHGELAWIRDAPYDSPLNKEAREWWFEFADDLVALFASRHGPKALPMEAHEMTIAHEAEGMGAVAVTVAFPLKVTLEGSPNCPTMAKLRGDFYDSMLKIPDVTIDKDNSDHVKMVKIRDGVVRFFNEVKVERTFFKRPKAGNQRLVVPVRDDFVIDFNLFALDEVHKAQAAAGGNICLKKDCGCQSLALVRGFTEALAGTDDHRRAQLEQRVMRALIEDNQSSKGSGGGNSSGASPSKAASSDARSSEADSGGEDEGDMLSMLMGAAVSDDSDSESDNEGSASKPPPAVARAVAAAAGGSARAPPAAPAASQGPSRPPAPRHDNVDLKANLKAGAVARLGALAKKLSKQSEDWDLAGLPPDCVCPITSEAFVEPVLCVGDGYTYEKGALDVWFLELSTSPVTGAELSTKDTVPNHAVKGIVDAFAAGNGVAAPSSSSGSGSSRSSGGSAPPSVPRARPAVPAPRARPAPKSNDLDSIYMSRKPTGAAAEIKSGAPAVRRPMVVEKDESDSEDEMSEEMFQAVRNGGGGSGGGSGRPVPSRPKPSTKAPDEGGGEGEGEKKKKSWSVFGKKK